MNNKKSDKIIFAIDFPDFDRAKDIIDLTSDSLSFYKIGLEMMASGDYFKTIEYLKKKQKKVFADLKLYDIPQTIGRAVKNLSKYDIDFLTIHSANQEIMRSASENKGNIKIIAVTVLTCLQKEDLDLMGFDRSFSISDLVIKKTKLALDSGIDGIVASGLETKIIREKLGNDFLIITPGIRDSDSLPDDQKRTVTINQAISYGASHVVIGRPISKSENPADAAKKFINMIK